MGVPGRWPRLRFRLFALSYAVVVGGLATAGFTMGSAPLILTAAALTLPSSLMAVPAYYLVYGMLAQTPGANPSQSSGSGSCAPDVSCQGSSSGDPAAWFTHTTELVGILALVAAAVVNVVLLHRWLAARRYGSPPQPSQ